MGKFSFSNSAKKNSIYLPISVSLLSIQFPFQVTRERREHEERVLSMLSTATAAKSSSSSAVAAPKVAEEDIRKFSKLNEELIRMGEENEKLREKMMGEEMAMKKKNAMKKYRKRYVKYQLSLFPEQNV